MYACLWRHQAGLSELEVVDAKLVTEKNKDDPIEEFEHKTTDSNCSIVFTRV